MDENGTEDIMDKQIKHVLHAEITDSEKEQIFSTNFDRWISRGH